MKNTEYFYDTVRRYRQCLTEINAKFDKRIAEKAGYAGSPRYTEDVKAIELDRASEIAALRADCAESFDTCIKSMELHAQSRPAVAPTDEQMRLVQLLKLKESVTRDDLTHAALACEGCPLALGVLEEIATAHDILGFHAGGNTLSDQFVRDAIRAFAKSARTTLTLDRTNNRAELMRGTEGPHGTAPAFGNIEKFRLDVDPENAQDCAGRWGGVPTSFYEAFCKAVDG